MDTQKPNPTSTAAIIRPSDRRSESREPLDERVTVTSLPNMEVAFAGRLTDTSFSGLGLTVPWPLKESAWIAVEWDNIFALGRVVYCAEKGSEFHAGLRTNYVIHDRTGSHVNSHSMKVHLSQILSV